MTERQAIDRAVGARLARRGRQIREAGDEGGTGGDRAARADRPDGGPAGEFTVPDATISTLAFFSMCNWGYQWYRPGGDVGYRDVALNFWRTFMSGVAVKPPPTPTWEAPANGQVRTP